MLRRLKYDLKWSWGDRCEAAKKPNAELSHLVSNPTAWDQIIITPKGDEPPRLADELTTDSHGLNLMRNSMGLPTYTERVEEVFRQINVDDTYTMCFWGVSQYIDLLQWRFDLVTYMAYPMDTFFANNPIHVTMYEHEPVITNSDTEDEESYRRERKHLESEKRYYLDLMFWSTKVRCPALPEKYTFRNAPEELERFSAELNGPQALIALNAATNGEGALGDAAADLSSTAEPAGKGAETARGGALGGLISKVVHRLRWIPDYTCAGVAGSDGRKLSRGDSIMEGGEAASAGAAPVQRQALDREVRS